MQKILHIGNGESVHFIQNRFLMDIKFQVSYMCFNTFYIHTYICIHLYISKFARLFSQRNSTDRQV